MSDATPRDPSELAAVLFVIVVLAWILIYLVPILFRVVWNIVPGVLVLMFIFAVLRGMISKVFK